MKLIFRQAISPSLLAGIFVLCFACASMAQQRRYEPSRPTVSPYLELFRNDNRVNPGLPNYHAFVRPLQQQYQINQTQQQLLQQQSQALGQLQSNLQTLERSQVTGQLVAPTGHGSWFNRESTASTFLNTSRYYSQSGTVGAGPRR